MLKLPAILRGSADLQAELPVNSGLLRRDLNVGTITANIQYISAYDDD